MTTGRTYRGTEECQTVYRTLLDAARQETQVFYTEVAEILGAAQGEPAAASEVGHLLGEISEDEHAAGRPMLAAVVLTGKGIPGEVFFAIARRLGALASTAPAEEMQFWMAERAKVYEAWKSGAA
jgi:hypothetical protein